MDHVERSVIASAVAVLEPHEKKLRDELDAARTTLRAVDVLHHPSSVSVEVARKDVAEIEAEATRAADVLVQLRGLIAAPTVEDAADHLRAVMPSKTCTCGALLAGRPHSIQPWCPALDPPSLGLVMDPNAPSLGLEPEACRVVPAPAEAPLSDPSSLVVSAQERLS